MEEGGGGGGGRGAGKVSSLAWGGGVCAWLKSDSPREEGALHNVPVCPQDSFVCFVGL